MKFLITFILLLIHIIAFSQVSCTIDSVLFASCNCDDCGVLNEDWKLTSGATKVCEGETFEIEALYDDIGVDAEYYRWQILSGDFSVVYVDTTIINTNLFEFAINLYDIESCQDLNNQVNLQLNLLVLTIDCNNGEVSCHNKLGPLAVEYKPRSNFLNENIECVDSQVSFTDLSCFAESYLWNFGDGSTSTEPSPTHQYNAPGIYQVSLTVDNECGSDTLYRQIEVVDYPEANIEMSVEGGEICKPDFLTLILNANEWTTGPSGYFNWSIDPIYTNVNGDWCFLNPEWTTGGSPCLPDSVFTNNTIDSLFLQENVELYFQEVGEYYVTLEYGNECDDLIVDDILYVYEPPMMSGLSDQSECDEIVICYNNLDLNVSGDYESVNWTFTGGDIFSSNDLNFGCVTFTNSGTITLDLEANDPCMDFSQTINVIIIETTTVSIPDPNPNVICQNSGLIQLFPSQNGGEYIYNGIPANFISNNILDPSLLEPQVYNVAYVLSDNPDCPAQDDFSFEIIEGPSITLGPNSTECESILDFNPNVESFSGDIDDWNWSILDDNGSTIGTSSTQFPSFDINIPGVFDIIIELSSVACGSVYDTSQIIIQQNIPVVIDSITTPYCQGSSPDTLIAIPPNGTWSGQGITNSQEGVFDPSGLNPGFYDITYSIVNGVCSSNSSITIEVVASEQVSTQDTFVCITDQSIQLSVNPTGGTFEGQGIIDSQLGIFDVMETGVGNNNVSYTYVDQNNCEIFSTIIVEVDSIPMLSFNDTIFVCIGNEDVELSELLNISSNGYDGTFTYNGLGITDQSNGTFNGTGFSEGFYTIYFEFDGRACSVQDSFIIDLADKPNLILPQDTTICISEGSFILLANIPNGSWSSSDCMIEPNGTVDLLMNGEGSCSFTYTLDQGTSCEQSGAVNLDIVDLDNDLFVPNPFSICYENDEYIISDFGPAGGIWAGDNIIDASNGIIDISSLNQDTTYVYTYCIQDLQINCGACKQTSITIESKPEANFALSGSPCQNQPFSIENLSSNNATTFIWDFGDGSTSIVEEPSHTYTSEGDFTISLISSTSFGCKDTIYQIVHVTPSPVVDLTINTENGCAPLEIEYINSSLGENISQYWIIDGIDTLFEEQPSIILDNVWTDSLITVELVVFNECEELRSSKDVLVHPYPIVNFGINDDEGCSPDTVFFMNSTVGLPENFLWDMGNGITYDDQDPTPQVYSSPDDSISIYTISLFAENMCGSDFVEKEIIVYPNNTDAFFEIDTLQGCPPLAVTITNYATIGSTISYDFGNGGTGNTPDTTYIYDEPGEYIITQYAALCGQDSIKSDTIIVYPLPEVAFSLPSFACVGETVEFINQSSNGWLSIWDFGDGNTSNVINPLHHYDQPGTYNVSLIVYSQFYNCPDTLTQSILVPELPISTFTPQSSEVCPGEMIMFQNQSIGAINFAWDFGDGSGSELESPVHTYENSGIYEVTLTVYDDFGCSADSTIINIIVNEDPLSSFQASDLEPCQFHDTIVFNNTSIGYINSIWNVNNVELSTNNDNFQIHFDNYGTQEIELISINSFGCTDSSRLVLDVLPSPIAISNFIDTSGCQELSLNFINLSQNSDLTNWYLDGNNASVDNNFMYNFVEHGNYKTHLVASSTNSCPPDSITINIDVYPRAISNFSISEFDSCGTPKSIQFENLSEFSNDYYWNFDNGNESNFYEPSTIFSSSGDYNVYMIANNEFNCPDTMYRQISLYPQPVAEFSLPSLRFCEGDTVQVINNSIGATNFQWTLNNSEIFEFPLLIYEAGTYEMSLIADYNQICFDTLNSSSIIEVFNSPDVQFTYIADGNTQVVGDVEFVNLSVDSEEYLWIFGNGNSSSETNPIYEFDLNGPINVCLYGYNHNDQYFTCENAYCEDVYYELINTFYVPNALSPNDNYGNQEVGIFKPKGIGIREYELNIYSPWGDRVCTLNQTLNGEPIDFWDGNFQGKPVPQGSYLWTAKIIYESGNTDFKKGNVTVIR